jgi:protein TonB
VVDEKGKISDVKVVRSVSRGIDQESMRVIKLLPKFSPGMQGGRPVKVKFIIPMDFHLASD